MTEGSFQDLVQNGDVRVTQAELNLKWNPSGTLKYLFIYLLGEYLIFNGDQVKSFQSSG